MGIFGRNPFLDPPHQFDPTPWARRVRDRIIAEEKPPYVPPTEPPPEVPPPGGDGRRAVEPPPQQYTISSTILDKIIPMVYGQRRVVGQLGAWDYESSTDTLTIGVIFCFGEQHDITAFKINNELVSGLTWVTSSATHTGDGSSAISSLLTNMSREIEDETVDWSDADTATWKKYAHAVVEINTVSASAPGSFKIEAVMGGRKVAPIGGGTKVMSTLPTRVAYDIETSDAWKGLAAAKIHETSWSAVESWCDEDMDDGGKRYEFSGIIMDRDPNTAREMVLRHCLANTYIDADGKRRVWCEMLPAPLTGTWSSGGEGTDASDDFESYGTGSLPPEWVQSTSSYSTFTVEDDSGNKVLKADSVTGYGASFCYWDDIGEYADVDLMCRVQIQQNYTGIVARAEDYGGAGSNKRIVAFFRRFSDKIWPILRVFDGTAWHLIYYGAGISGVSVGDWRYIRLYVKGNVVKIGQGTTPPTTFMNEWSQNTQTWVNDAGYVGAYFNPFQASVDTIFDDFTCGIDARAVPGDEYDLVAINSDGAATTELEVGDEVIYDGEIITVDTITDDDNIIVDTATDGYELPLRLVDLLHIKLTDWVVNPSSSETNIFTVPDIIRASYNDGTELSSNVVGVSYGSGTDKITELSLPGCNDPKTAGRVALTNLLLQNLQPYYWAGVVGPEIGAQLEPGDVITFDTDIFEAQKARVLPPVEANPNGTFTIKLREYDAAAYSDDPGAVDTVPGPEEGWDGNDIPPSAANAVQRSGATEGEDNYMYGDLQILNTETPSVTVSNQDDPLLSTWMVDRGINDGGIEKRSDTGEDAILTLDAHPGDYASEVGKIFMFPYSHPTTSELHMFMGDGTASDEIFKVKSNGQFYLGNQYYKPQVVFQGPGFTNDQVLGMWNFTDPITVLEVGSPQFPMSTYGSETRPGYSTDYITGAYTPEDYLALYSDIVDEAADVSADTTNFNNNLSGSDDTVQKALDTLDNMSGGGGDADAIHDNVANEITAITPKTTIVDADEFILEDSGASYVKKAVTALNLSNYMSGGSFLPLSAGSSYPLTGDLYIEGSTSPLFSIEHTTSASHFDIYQDASWAEISTTSAADRAAVLDIVPKVTTSGYSCQVKFFRYTDTSGSVDLRMYKGDNSAVIQHAFECDTGNASLCRAAGDLTVGSSGATSNLYVDSNSIPTLYLREAGSTTDYSTVKDGGVAMQIAKIALTGDAIITLSAAAVDGTSDAFIRVFRNTNTVGARAFEIYEGDGSASLQHSFDCATGDVNLCQQGGSTGEININEAQLLCDNNWGGVKIAQTDGTTYRYACRMDTSNVISLGDVNVGVKIRGSATRPLYNTVDLALYSDIGGHDIEMDSSSDARIIITVKNSTGVTIPIRSLCYISADSSGTPLIVKADADSYTTSSKMLVCLPAAILHTASGTAVIKGVVSGFSSLTPSYIQYVSTTAGAFTQSAPGGTNDVVRVAGYAISTTEIFFDPGKTWVEIS